MALGEAQKEMAVILFVKAFAAADEKSRKELYIQFADAYEGSIQDWKIKVEKAFENEECKEIFRSLNKEAEQNNLIEFVIIEPLKKEDLKQISYIASKELDMVPGIEHKMELNSINDYVYMERL